MTPRPSEPVEVPAARTDHVEGRGAGAAGLVPTAALVFGGVMWLVTAWTGVHGSETDGIRMSWIAIFPTVFGLVARGVRNARLDAGRPAVAAPLLAGLAAGLGAVVALWVFFEGIWPSL